METTRREVVIDTKLAELYEREMRLLHKLDAVRDDLTRYAGFKRVYEGRRQVWRKDDGTTPTLEEILTGARAATTDESKASYEREYPKRSLASYDELVAEIKAVREEQAPLDALYEKERWSRFFLVQNSGGHIHSSMHCSTCFPTTRFGWLPTLSGLTEKDAVEAHGTILCSVCFPSAPVEWTLGKQDDDDICKGRPDWDKPHRKGYYSGNWATCSECGEHVTLTKNWNLRKHKKKVTA